MYEKPNKDAPPEALATFAAAARNSEIKPAGHGVSATGETSGKPKGRGRHHGRQRDR
jgi:hypothetical protein